MRKKMAIFFLLAAAGATSAAATELVYTPVNPSFHGNPLNGPWLLNSAQAQNDTRDPNANSTDPNSPQQQSALANFNEMLQRAILNRLSSMVVGSIIGPSGELLPGTVETTDFRIEITDLGGGVLQVTTTDKTTGEFTSFRIDSAL